MPVAQSAMTAGRASVMPACGFWPEMERSPIALPYRTLLNGKFYVGRVPGSLGGYGITYLAWDMLLHTQVAIKEFFPSAMATRAPTDPAVIPHSEADRATFSAGLEVFLTEAGTLARFSHPNIARVREFFTENSTGYCVMDDYDGQSLPEYLQRTGALLSPGLA
ncbi:MAG: hypothetical protein HOI95_18985 [Chromatiales bacterium]|nr:hypothetical protein [Chromatiales bacterium]